MFPQAWHSRQKKIVLDVASHVLVAVGDFQPVGSGDHDRTDAVVKARVH